MIFEVKFTYMKTCDNGLIKKTTEAYLVKAENFTDAEYQMGEYAEMYGINDWSITAIRIVNYSELFKDEDGDCHFDVSLKIITLDEKTGREKQTSMKMLVFAKDIEHAKEVLNLGMKGTMIDYRIAAIKESPIIDTIGFYDEEN